MSFFLSPFLSLFLLTSSSCTVLLLLLLFWPFLNQDRQLTAARTRENLSRVVKKEESCTMAKVACGFDISRIKSHREQHRSARKDGDVRVFDSSLVFWARDIIELLQNYSDLLTLFLT